MKLLDTTFLIHHWQGADEVATYLGSNEDHTFVTTTLNLRELATGRALQGEFDHNELRATFDWVTVLAFEAEHAYAAGELEAELRRENINQDRLNALAGDILIAAVAEREGATVVTRNTSDFELLDVPVETY